MRGDSGIDPTAKEAYLSDAEFEKVGVRVDSASGRWYSAGTLGE